MVDIISLRLYFRNKGVYTPCIMLNEFIEPRPNKTLINILAPVNRYICLKGLPVLRDIPGLNRLIGCRGICNVRHIEFPQSDQERLKSAWGSGKASFITPNHPEFFTDWMLDKHIISLVSPLAASWATNGVVNGLGKLAQRFWLANNLIAQIPGNSEPSLAYSVEWALKGHGVLLHPEGGVGWHSNYIAPLFPGAFNMANEALVKGKNNDSEFESFVVPVVWKLVYLGDVKAGLIKECHYIERKQKIPDVDESAELQDRLFHIFMELLLRDEQKWEFEFDRSASYRTRQQRLITELKKELSHLIDSNESETKELISSAKRWLRETDQDQKRKKVRDLVNTITRHACLDDYAFVSPVITQEDIGDHLKRLRRDYCKGDLRDTLNAFFPQPAGSRRAHIRVPEAFALHETKISDGPQQLRQRMQNSLDALNAELDEANSFIKFKNPFYV